VVDGNSIELKSFGSRHGINLLESVERANKVRAKLEERMRLLLVVKRRAESSTYFATLVGLISPIVSSDEESGKIESRSRKISKLKECEKQFTESLISVISACDDYLES
jgi:hypothetical protein